MVIQSNTFRILSNGQTLGTGFLVAKDLVVTCAHVVESVMSKPIQLQIHGQSEILSAQVVSDYFRDPKNGDIAFLRLDHNYENIKPLRLGVARNSRRGNVFQAFGYPSVEGIDGIHARGELLGMVQENGRELLQLRSQELNKGHSGAPVIDDKRDVIIGMVVSVYRADMSGKLRDTAFAIPSETLFEVCNEIQPSEVCPYLGLNTFTIEMAQYFFGRETLTKKLIGVLRGGCRFLAVLGPSGSGKSSVVQAGLFRALKEDQLPGSEKWAQITMRPAEDPFQQLAAEGLPQFNINQYLELHKEYDHIILFIDQFEELFTFCPDELRSRFVIALTDALKNPNLIVILSMRDDFYSAFYAKAAPLANSDQLTIENVPATLDRNELVAIIERPASSVGLALEEGLTELILNDVETQDETRSAVLPLLEFALSQLWVKCKDGILTHERYNAIGGVTGSLARWADKAYSKLLESDRPYAESLLTSLVQLGYKAEDLAVPDARRRRALIEFDEPTRHVIKHFADHRLLVTNRDTVELIHDTLLREWKLLSKWLEDNREFLTWRQKLTERFKEWKAGKAELLRGRELTIAQNYRDQKRRELGDLSKYISQSERQFRLTRLIIAGGIGLAFTLLAAFGVFAWNQRNNAIYAQSTTVAAAKTQLFAVANEQIALSTAQAANAQAANVQATSTAIQGIAVTNAQRADEEAIRNLSQQLANDATSRFDRNYTLGLLLGVESFHMLEVNNLSEGEYPDTLPELLSKMQPGLIRTLDLNSGKVRKVIYSPSGNLMVAISDTVNLWNSEDPSIPIPVTNWKSLSITPPSDVVFSPNGKLMVIGYQDGNVEIWDVSAPNFTYIKTLSDFSSQSVNIKVTISADSKVLAVAGNTTIKMWDISTPHSPKELGSVDHPHEISDRAVDISYLSFAPGSTAPLLLSGGQDHFVRIWNVQKYDYHPNISLGNPFDFDTGLPVLALNSKYLIIADKKSIRIFFYSNTGREFAGSFRYDKVHQEEIKTMAISPDGKKLYSSTQDGLIAEWDLADPRHMELIRTFVGPTGHISSIAFHKTGNILAVGGDDSKIVLWNIIRQNIDPMWQDLLVSRPEIGAITYNPKSNLLAIGDVKGSIILWDISNPLAKKEKWRTPISSPVRHIVFGPNETTLFYFGDWSEGKVGPTVYTRDLTRMDYSENLPIFNTNTADIFAVGNHYILAGEGANNKISIYYRQIINMRSVGEPHLVGFSTCPFKNTAFTQNGNLAAIVACTLQLWDFSGEKPPALLRELESYDPRGVAFNSDGTILASANGNNSISIWNILPGGEIKLERTISAHNSAVTSVAFSPDGKIMASGGEDHTVILWDIKDPKNPSQRVVLEGHTNAVINGGLFFSVDGKTLISASKNEVIFWDIDGRSWVEKACSLAGRNLTQQEWQEFVAQFDQTVQYHATCPDLPVP